MTFEIRPAEIDSEADLRGLTELIEASELERYGAVGRRTLQQQRNYMLPTDYHGVQHYVAVHRSTGTLTGYATVHLPLAEDTDNVDLEIEIHPDWRGRGIGKALASRGKHAAKEAGREKVTLWAFSPLDGDPDSDAVPANRVAHLLGLQRRNISILHRLELPVPPALLATLAAEAEPHLDDAGCRVVLWRGPIPDEHFERYGPLLEQLELDEPDEDMELDAKRFDAQRLRAINERNAARGIDSIVAVVVAPDGSFAGNSELRFSATPGTTLIEQESTLVMPAWRGHRFGLAMKAATHAMLAEVMPAARACVTWNSHVNDQMIAINQRLGYRPLLREIGYQSAH